MKRLLAFLLLLGLGLVALHFALGDEQAVSVGTATGTKDASGEGRPAGEVASGVPIEQGPVRAMGAQNGPFEFVRWRTLPEVDGHARKEEVYALKAEDSRPIGAGRQELDGVTVKLFDDGVHTATLTASKAFVALRPDASGRPSPDEGKDIDLRDVVLTTLPASRLPGLRLEMATARVKIEDDEILLTTPREEPVLLVLTGQHDLRLRGLGAQALLPGNRTGALRRADVEILADPVLEGEGLTVKAKGRLRYVEDLDSGAGTVTLDDRVELDVARADLQLPGDRKVRAKGGDGSAHIRGDQFIGWLQRCRERDADGRVHQQTVWRQLVLTGAPAVVEMPDGRLYTPKLTALPGLFGDPLWLTAHGGESRLEQTGSPGSRQKADELVTGTSQRRIHFAMPRAQLGALHRSFGFPAWSMRPLEQLQIAVVEGAAHMQGGARSLAASDGVRVYRREGSQTGIVRGLGDVRVEQRATAPNEQDLVATGNDGFTLTATAAHELLQLGPRAPADLDAPGAWREHAFDVRHGSATMRGKGVCEIERIGEDTRVDFVSPDGRMVATMPEQGLQLQRVRRLQGRFLGKVPTELDVAGWPTGITLARGTDTMVATAPRVLQTGPRSLRLLPPDAGAGATWSGLAPVDRLPSLRRSTAARGHQGPQQLEVRGPSIDVHHAGGHDVLVDAIAVADELPHVYARLDQREGREATTIACAAERLRLLPFVLSPDVQRWLTASEDGPLARVTFHGLGRPWLLVDEVREFQLDDARQGHVEGRGKRLLVSQGGRAALFVGDPDDLVPATVTRTQDDRTVTLCGARVRLIDDEDVRLQALETFADRSTLLLPTMTLHEAKRTGLLSHMQATCRGNIEVLPEAVEFGGPVTASGLRADGTPDPAGLGLDARQLRMLRDRKSGELVQVVGKDVVVDWTRLHATAADVELDLRRDRLVAADPNEATVTLPDGREFRSPRLEVNYETLALRISQGLASQRRDGEGRK